MAEIIQMPPEEFLNREDLEAVIGVDTISVDPDSYYQRKDFVDKAGKHFDLSKYYLSLSQNPGDIGAINDIANLLNPQNPGIIIRRGAEGALRASDMQLAFSGVNLAKYTKKNELEKKLDGKQLSSFILQLAHPENSFIYVTGKEKHDKLAEIVKRQAAIAFDKVEVLKADISKLMKNAPAWHQALYARYAEDPQYQAEFLQSYASIIGKVFEREFTKEVTIKREKKRELDEDKLHKFYRENLKVAEDAMEDEPDEKTKYDIWDKNIKPIYLATAQKLYISEKAKQKAKDQSKAEGRKRERKALGLAA